MFRASLLLAAAVALIAGSAAAQERTWTVDRPDGVAPPGVFADRTLDPGQVEVSAVFSKMNFSGVRFGTDFLTVDQTLSLFDVAPLSLSSQLLELRASIGLDQDLTLVGRTGFVFKDREQVTSDAYFTLESQDLTDSEVHLLWEVFDDGGVRAHLQGGILIPTGSVDEEESVAGIRSGILPYDMQTGAGTFAALPGFTIQMQNEYGTVGAQVVGRIYFSDNDRGWRPGNAVEANGWAAYRLNDFFSLTARVHALGWGAIQNADDALDPFRDPGELATSFGGNRVDLPVGLNIYMPEGRLAGHRLSVEWVSTVHEDLDGPWLAADNGFVIAWQKAVGR